MTLNKYMHPRNRYKNEKPNFKEYTLKYPEFRKHVTQDLDGKVYLNFKNLEAMRVLTKIMLKEDFNFDVAIPPDRLTPTIPLRLNYIHWLEDILGVGDKSLKGIDIGTGCCCIYPLLGYSMNKWKFLATEADATNYEYAQKNISTNEVQDHIKVVKVTGDSILMSVLNEDNSTHDFCMCNPPFFADSLEAQGLTNCRKDDRKEPSSACTASEVESVADGGETTFISRIIEESLQLRHRIRVFSSMVGKKTNLPKIKEELRRNNITNFGTTEFCQGKTMRWGVAWTFKTDIKFPKSEFQQSKLVKAPLTWPIPRTKYGETWSIESIWKDVRSILLELKFHLFSEKCCTHYAFTCVTAKENTWSHRRQKRRQEAREKVMREQLAETGKHAADADMVDSDDVICVHHDKETKLNSQSSVTNEAGDNTKIITLSHNQEPKNEPVNMGEESTEMCASGGAGSPTTSKSNTLFSENSRLSVKCSSNPDACGNTELTGSGTHQEELSKECKIITSTEQGSKDSMLTQARKRKCNETHSSSDGLTDAGNSESHRSLKSKHFDQNYLMKCSIGLKKERGGILLEMKWIDGENREVMHQVLQYCKNWYKRVEDNVEKLKT